MEDDFSLEAGEAERSAVASSERSNAGSRRGKNGSRGTRFTVTFFGHGGEDREAVNSDRPEGAEEKESHRRAAPPSSDSEGEEESSSQLSAHQRDEEQVQRRDGRDRPGVPGVSPQAQRLSDELRDILLKEKKVQVVYCTCPFEPNFKTPVCLLHFS